MPKNPVPADIREAKQRKAKQSTGTRTPIAARKTTPIISDQASQCYTPIYKKTQAVRVSELIMSGARHVPVKDGFNKRGIC